MRSGRVLITSQNHGFAVQGDQTGVTNAPDLEVTGVLRQEHAPLVAHTLHGGDRDCQDGRARCADVRSDDERRRYYTVTGHGRAVLDAEVARMARLVRAARLSAAGKRARLT